MKKLLLSLLMILFLNSVNSQSTMYGIQWNDTLSVNYFVSIDPVKGFVTQIDSLPGLQDVYLGVSAINAVSEYYICTDANNVIYTIDMNTGVILSSPTLTSPIGGLHYDEINEKYYAIEVAVVNTFLVEVEPSSGLVTRIDSIPGVYHQGSIKSSVYDSNHNLLVLIDGKDIIYTVDVTIGSTISSYLLPSSIEELQFNPLTGAYYAIEYDQADHANYLVKVDITTGNLTRFNSIQGLMSFQNGSSTIDTLTNLFYIIDHSRELISIDLLTGNVNANPVLNNVVSNIILNTNSISESITSNMSYFEAQSNSLPDSNTNPIPIKNITKTHSGGIITYPNPASEYITISVNAVPTILTIYDKDGIPMRNITLNNPTTILNISEYEHGIYFFNLSNSDEIVSNKIMVR